MRVDERHAVNCQSKIHVRLVLLFGIVVVMCSVAVFGFDSQGERRLSLSVEDPRPLAEAIQILEERHGWVITYEDLRYVYVGDLVDITRSVREDLGKHKPGEAPKLFVPKGGALTFEYDAPPQASQQFDVALVVQQLIRTQAASGTAGRFRLERTGQMMHVIPSKIKNSAGVLTLQSSVLDTIISISPKDRTVEEKLEAVLDAVTRAARIPMWVATVPQPLLFQLRDKQGAANQKARDVLETTLEGVKAQDGRSLSWRLLYDPTRRQYALNIHTVPTRGH